MKINPRCFVWCGLVLLLALPGMAQQPKRPVSPASFSATTQAVERLIRSTRRGAEEREPFQIKEGPADPKPDEKMDNILETAILKMQDEDYEGAIPLLETALEDMPTTEAIWEETSRFVRQEGRWLYIDGDVG